MFNYILYRRISVDVFDTTFGFVICSKVKCFDLFYLLVAVV